MPHNSKVAVVCQKVSHMLGGARVKAKSTKISFSAKTYPEPEGARWKQTFSGRYEG